MSFIAFAGRAITLTLLIVFGIFVFANRAKAQESPGVYFERDRSFTNSAAALSGAVRNRRGAARRLSPAMRGAPAHRLRGLSSCTPAVLRSLVSRFGLRVISGYRPGARVAGSGRRSNHSYCGSRGAVDVRGGQMGAAIRYARAHGLGVGTYSGRHNHVHFSTQASEQYHSGGRRKYRGRR